MDPLIRAWDSTPESIKGIIIGSILTLAVTTIVTLLANRHARKLQDSEFAFESSQRKLERAHALRSSVYLGMAEAVAKAMSAMLRGIDLRVTDAEINDASMALDLAVSRLHTVARPETMRAIANFQREYTIVLADLRVVRGDLSARQIMIDGKNNLIRSAMNESDQLLELLKAYNREGMHDARKWEAAQKQYEQTHARMDDLFASESKLSRELAREQIRLFREVFDKVVPLQPYLRASLLAIRNDLGLEDATAALGKELDRTDEEMRNVLETILRKFEDRVARDEAEDANELKQMKLPVTSSSPNP